MSDAPNSPDRILTVPNLITFIRLICVPVFLWLLYSKEDRLGAAVLLGVLGATDWLDGWIARRFDQTSTLGKILDPTTDRILLLVGALTIALDGSVPWWFAGLALFREGAVSVMALILAALGATRIDVTWWGKTGTFFLMFSFPLFLASHADWALADASRVAAWLCGIPGLIIGYKAAVEYIPIAREALIVGREGRKVARGV